MKKVLLAGLVCLTGAASLMAADVTSINAVGYMNVSLAPGFNMIANQLNASDNSIGALIASPTAGMKVYKFTGSAFAISTYVGAPFNAWNPNGTATLAPGEGAFVQNPTGSSISLTFVGEVLTGNLSNPLPAGFSIRSSQVPQGGAIDTALGYVPAAGDKIYRYNGNGYTISTYVGAPFNAWNPSVPSINVGESFFVFKNAAGSWNRTFSIQ